MKTAILALATLVTTVQTVGWVECCCILICKHHNDPCKDECKDQEQKTDADCCEKPASKAPVHQHDRRCAHVEPSSEILTPPTDQLPAMPVLILDLPLVDFVAAPVASDAPSAVAARGSPPLLHLLFGALLI